MERNLLKEEIQTIQMPAAMQARILENCRSAELEEKEKVFMAKNISENEQNAAKRSGNKWTRFASVAAAIALCLGFGGVTVMAANGKLEGFFADVTRWDGAVVGTTYEQATEEIEVSASVSNDSIIIDVTLLKAGEAPYMTFEQFGAPVYSIEDASGNVIVEGISSVAAEITDGKVVVELPADAMESGNYKLIITEFTGSSKADQPLPVKGYWVCEFAL